VHQYPCKAEIRRPKYTGASGGEPFYSVQLGDVCKAVVSSLTQAAVGALTLPVGSTQQPEQLQPAPAFRALLSVAVSMTCAPANVDAQ
jgi:hypothetical protein